MSPIGFAEEDEINFLLPEKKELTVVKKSSVQKILDSKSPVKFSPIRRSPNKKNRAEPVLTPTNKTKKTAVVFLDESPVGGKMDASSVILTDPVGD